MKLFNSVVLAMFLLITSAAECNAYDVLDQACRDYRTLGAVLKRQIERPQPPSCATIGWSFDEYSFQTCRTDMEEYRKKVGSFTKCLQSENERAVDELNDTVRQFNEKASK